MAPFPAAGASTWPPLSPRRYSIRVAGWHWMLCLRSPSPRTLRCRLPRVLDRDVEAFDDLVAPGLPGRAPGGAVEVELLIERHRRRVVDPELVDALIELEPALGLHDGLGLVDHAVEVGVVVIREDLAGAEQRHIHRLRVVRARAPAD